LFDNYGKITPQQVKAKEMELYNMHYNISQPVDSTVFNNIDDLSELAYHAGSPMTDQQMINLAYVIFARQPILQQDLCLWNRRPLIDRTWPNMMQHLRDAQTDLSYLPPSAGDIYNQQPVHQANVTTMADLVAQRLFDEYNQPPPSVVPPIPTPPTPDHHIEVTNSLQRRETDLQSREAASMMSQMQDMMLTLMHTNGKNQPTNTNHSPCSGSGHDNRSNRSGRNTTGQGSGGHSNGCGNNRSQAHLYGWSHGACAHTGTNCNTPANGHQLLATFANMMNRSTNGCHWL
jgi:hypothetical protein